MNPTTHQAWKRFHTFEAMNEPHSYTRTLEVERMLTHNGVDYYLVQFEVSVKRWTDDAQWPSIDCVSTVVAYDQGSNQVLSQPILDALWAMAKAWCEENMHELCERMEKE